MKNKKWLTYTLGVLLTLVVLAVVGGAGFRLGMMQNASFARIQNGPRLSFKNHDLDSAPQGMQGDSQNDANPPSPQGNFTPQGMHGNFQGNGMPQDFQRQRFGSNQGFDRRDGRFPFFFPVFGLIHLAVLGLLLWIVYKLVKKSGWKLSLTKTSPSPAPTPSGVEEKKASE